MTACIHLLTEGGLSAENLTRNTVLGGGISWIDTITVTSTSTGGITIIDGTTTSATSDNTIISLTPAQSTPGAIYELHWPCQTGISVLPGGGTVNVCYNTSLPNPYNGAVYSANFLTQGYASATAPLIGGMGISPQPESMLTTLNFNRAGISTCADVNGIVQTAAIDVPAISYDPTSNAPLGIAAYQQQSNLVRGSVITPALWTFNGLISAINAAIAPDGTLSATMLTENGGTSVRSANLTSSVLYTTTLPYTHSAFLKAGTSAIAQISASASVFSGVGYANFDLINGVVTASTGLVSSGMQYYGNGWWRCWIVENSTATTTGSVIIYATGNTPITARGPSYVGDTSLNFYVWGVNSTQTTILMPYLPTAASGSVVASPENLRLTDPAFSRLTNNQNGTIFVDAMIPSCGSPTANQIILQLDDGTDANRMGISNATGSNSILGFATSGGEAWVGIGGLQSGVPFRVGLMYQPDRVCVGKNGGFLGFASSGNPPFNTIRFGRSVAGSNMNGYIRGAWVYPYTMTDTEFLLYLALGAPLP